MSDPHAWRDRAACRGVPVAVFFPKTRNEADGVIARWCARCDVQPECLADEQQQLMGSRNGVRGGVLWAGRGGSARKAVDPHGFLGDDP